MNYTPHTGFPTLWTFSPGIYHSLEKQSLICWSPFSIRARRKNVRRRIAMKKSCHRPRCLQEWRLLKIRSSAGRKSRTRSWLLEEPLECSCYCGASDSRIFPVQANYRTGRWPPDLKVSMAIKDFEDARKSDIENKRLPPDLYDADSEEGKALFASGSLPSTPAEHQEGTPSTPFAANGVAAGLEATLSSSILPSPLSLSTSSSISFP